MSSAALICTECEHPYDEHRLGWGDVETWAWDTTTGEEHVELPCGADGCDCPDYVGEEPTA